MGVSKGDIEYMLDVDPGLAADLGQIVTRERCNIDIPNQTCSLCYGWQRIGIPCPCAASALMAEGQDMSRREFWEENFDRSVPRLCVCMCV